ARDEVRPKLESLGAVIGDPSSIVYDFVEQRLIVRSTSEKVGWIETVLAWGSASSAEAKPEPAPEMSRYRKEIGGIEDTLPNPPWKFGPPEKTKEILLPK